MSRQAALLFGSETLPGILAALAEQPGRTFTAAELGEAIGRPNRDSLYRALRRAVEVGVVRKQRVGGRSVYQIDIDAPIYPELKNLVSKLLGVTGAIQDALSQLDKHQLELAFVYGSVARGGDTYRSDVDLFAIGAISGLELATLLRHVQATYQREINPVVYGHSELEAKLAAGDPFLSNIWNSPKLFLVGDEAALPSTPGGDVAPQFRQELRVGQYSRPYATFVIGGVPGSQSELDDQSMEVVEAWFRQLCPKATPRRSLPQVLWWQLDGQNQAQDPEWQGWLHPGPVVAVRQVPELVSIGHDAFALDLPLFLQWWRSLAAGWRPVLDSLGVDTIRMGLTLNTYGLPAERITDLSFGSHPRPVAGAPNDQVSPWHFESPIFRVADGADEQFAEATRLLLRHFSYRRLDATLASLAFGQ